MANDDNLTEEQIREMERKLLGYDPAKQTVVTVRKSRRIIRDPANKPSFEVEERLSDDGTKVYDFYFIPLSGQRELVHRGLTERDARIQMHEYRVDKANIRTVR